MKNKIRIHVLLLVIILSTIASCKKERVGSPEPEPTTPELPLITTFSASPKAAILDLTYKQDPLDGARNLYSAEHILTVSGVPFVKTQDMTTAMNASLIVVSSPIEVGFFTPEQIDDLTTWVEGGGVVIAPVCKDQALEGLFGFSGAPNYHKNRYLMSWSGGSHPELSYFDHLHEKTISLGRDNGGNNVLKSYGYTLSASAQPLASFDTNEVAVIRNGVGAGRAYTFGLEWRDVVQRPQLNRDFEAHRIYSNGFEPSSDVFPLFVRSVWNDIQPVSAWKHTSPNGSKTVLIPTHDVDATSGFDEMVYMSDYEKSIGVSGHYFITTRYFADDIAKPYYIDRTIQLVHDLLDNGHTIGSHSVGHFPDMTENDRFPLGSASIVREDYNPGYIDGQTRNATTFGEVKVSKDILELDFGVDIQSFRSGHLCTNSSLTEALDGSGYKLSSCYTACDLLSGFPFFDRIGQGWGGELTSVLQMPIHISDVFSDDKITSENYMQKVDIWLDVVNAHKNNYAPCVILIHPNRDWKMFAMREFVDKVNKADFGFCKLDEYGHFWNARTEFDFEFDYQQEHQQLVIKSTPSNIRKAATVGIMVEGDLPIKNYRLIDGNFNDYPISIVPFGDGKNLVLIK